MSIVFDENLDLFCLETANTSYIIGLADHRQYPNPAFLKIAESVGNTAIIGCDAHHPSALLDTDSQQACKKLAEQYHLPLMEVLPQLSR